MKIDFFKLTSLGVQNYPFMAFCVSETQDCFICSMKCNFELIFLQKNLNSNKNVIKIMPNITCSCKTCNLDNSSKNTKFQKVLIIPISTLDELFNDTALISLQSIYSYRTFFKIDQRTIETEQVQKVRERMLKIFVRGD